MRSEFFPPKSAARPKIYAYQDTNPQYAGLLKIGFTNGDAARRVTQQYPTLRPGEKPYRIVLVESAMRSDGSNFSDHDVHRWLKKQGFSNPAGEWFRCGVEYVKAAILSLRKSIDNPEKRSLNFALRPEQKAAVERTYRYFKRCAAEQPDKVPHFLWNAKMRFGKTFAAYQLALRMGWQRILVLTFQPAVQDAWEQDLRTHIDFEGWQFITREGLTYEKADTTRPIVCFGSFQDYLDKNNAGGIKPKNEWVHTINWDCIILDEYHYGAWREKAKDLYNAEHEVENDNKSKVFSEELMPITAKTYLYLSGTPFRAISSGEFIEEQIYNWTYSDEQQAKEAWQGDNNPYASLPRMVMLTYKLPDSIHKIAQGGEFNQFNLNLFFSTSGEGETAHFKYETEVQNWLNLIRGQFHETALDDLKLGAQKPPMPFSDARLIGLLSHTFWFLPSIDACYAMRNLLAKKQNTFYHDYKVIVAAGEKAGSGVAALPPVKQAMADPLTSKTITLSCGKLTTGVTVKPWTGIFMLRNCSSPETYFQAAFRVQSPWVIDNPDGQTPNAQEILKQECYVFDFAPDRALRLIAEYSCRLNIEETNPEKKVEEFIHFLPILAYDGSSMKEIDAAGVLDMAMSGTTATLLARRWESALLVNVDNPTLQRLMDNEQALKALMRVEGFRTLNKDIETIINKSDTIKKLKKEANDRDLTTKEKKQLSNEEKEYKSLRKQIQEKLIKFATRIPIFMYLTDYRENSLKEIITQLEPQLFKKVTGIDVAEFEILVSLNVFNSQLMNDAIYKFKRYEDASLNYTGINRHEGLNIGLYDTTLSRQDYEQMKQ